MGLPKSEIAARAAETPPIAAPAFSFELENVCLNRADRAILQNITWRLAAGASGAIVGPNGSGKSTLMRMLAGYVWPTSGTVRVLGHTLGEFSVLALRRNLAIVEALSLYPMDDDLTARQAVCTGFFGTLTLAYDHPQPEHWDRCDELLAQFHVFPRRNQRFMTLSTGERMRCLLARALVHRPALLLLDEPTNGLDLPTRENLLRLLADLRTRQNPPAIVMVSHFLEEILPDTASALLLNAGGNTIASGHPEDVFTPTQLSAAFAWPIDIRRHNGRFFAHGATADWPEENPRI